jgi:hypothetical protein
VPQNLMIVLSNTRPEVEAEFNSWYTDVHVVDVVEKLDGFETAQRFKLADGQVEDGTGFQYLAIYTIADDQLEQAQAAIAHQRQERAEALAAGRAPWIEARKDLFEGRHHSWFFTAVSDVVSGS